MTPVSNAYISYMQTSLKGNFCHKTCFLLLNLFPPSFNRSHQEVDMCGEKNFFSFIHLALNVFLMFDFITCSQRSRQKICDGTCVFDGQRLQSTAMLMNSNHVLHNSVIQIQACLEPPNYLIHYGESCVNHLHHLND